MTTLNPCTPVIVPTQRPLLLRWLEDAGDDLRAAWQSWQAARRTWAEQRALAHLSDATLRDIGLAERRFDDPTLGKVDWERGYW